MASVLSRIQIIMEANTANYNNELRRAQQNSGKNFKKIKKAAGAMALGVGAAIVGMGTKALHTAGNFEEAMNAISAVSGATGKDFDDLREKAKQLGSETAYSATEAASGMEFLAKAGLDTTQILNTIPNALALASAGSIDLAQSADILSNIMSGMGIAAEDSGRAADVLAKAAASANVDVSMMGESMKYVAPIAKQMGMTLEETSAIIGVLGNAGIQASQAGTSLRGMFTRFTTNNAAVGAFKELGVTLTDGNGKMRSMIDVMKDLSVATDGLDPASKLDYFKDMAGVEAMSALAVAVDAAADGSLQKLKGTLDEAKGSAEEMAAIRMEGLKGSFKGLASAWEGFQIQLADGGALTLAATAVNAVADSLRALTKSLPQIIANFQAFVESVGVVDKLQFVWGNLVSVISRTAEIIAPVINFFREHQELSKSLAIAIGAVAGAILTYNASIVVGAAATVAFTSALALVTAPMTLIVVGITALVAAGVYLYRNWDEIKAKAVEVWDGIASYIGDKITEIKNYFSTNFPAMTAIVSGALKTITTVISTGFALIKNTVTTVLATVRAVIKGDFGAIPGIIGNGLKSAASIVSNMMGSILNIIKEAGKKLFSLGRDFINGFVSGIKSVGSNVVSAASSMVGSAIEAVRKRQNSNSDAKETIKLGKDFSSGMATGVRKGAKAVVAEAQRMTEQAIQAVEDGIESLKKRISLFGDNSELSSLLYDINAGKYAGASDARIRELVLLATAYEQVEARAKAANAIQQRFDKWQDARDKLRSNATGLIRERAAQFGQAKASASSGLQDMLGGLEQQSPMGKIQADYEARNAIIEQYEQTHTNMVETANEARIASDQAYMAAKRDLMLNQGEALFGDLAGMAKSFAGEQSGIYRALFAVEKGFAIAQSAMAIQQSIAKAMAVGFPQNIPIIGQAVSQGAKIASNIKSIAMPVGQAHDGIANVPREGTWVLDKNERVVKPKENRQLGRFLDREERAQSNRGGVNINITNNAPVDVSARVNDNGDIEMRIDKRINERVPQMMAQQINTPATPVRNALTNNFNLERRF